MGEAASTMDKKQILGLFRDGDDAALAIKALRKEPWNVDKVHSPFPHHGLLKALRLKKSRVGLFTLAGGIIGFFTGFGLAIFTATRWELIVSGKPIVALIPFFIVGFEVTILFSVIGNLVGFLTQARLPDFEGLQQYDPQCSGDRFGIVASCSSKDGDALMSFFRKRGGEGIPLDNPINNRDEGNVS